MKDSDTPEYVVRNYDAIDQQVAEIAAREREITNRLKIANYRRMAMIGIIAAAAISMIILAVGIALWLAKDSVKEIVTVPGEEHQVKVVVETVPGTVIRDSSNPAPTRPTTGSSEWSNSAPVGSSNLASEAIKRVDEFFNNQSSSDASTPQAIDRESTSSNSSRPPNQFTESSIETLIDRSEIGRTTGSGARIHLLWEGFHDLDLIVIEPSGSRIFYGQKVGASGGYLDIDQNVEGRPLVSKPVESISWTNNQLKNGKYQIAVSLYRVDTRSPFANGVVPFNVIIFRDGREEVIEGSVSVYQKQQPKRVRVYEI